ncbi:hypothetical protein SERLADRAFT_459545 [Serpula lacrymans var. lacrymans S7.9]|uniref:Uncharacterized protein n=1 Tax=Serpula lacrymans var. lacrymans (strain S7.9) TaxID=578457 RepID=F8NKJ3_SERL9|nr:uncharacterized protein SERLADRAFT_459545 [Serpula lacrymans var. lacrymans S7.9]EGO28766.1 hypothetical protein SERLADRAFT_459545 [Serpula lacrymans var. lacrymans S7.9]
MFEEEYDFELEGDSHYEPRTIWDLLADACEEGQQYWANHPDEGPNESQQKVQEYIWDIGLMKRPKAPKLELKPEGEPTPVPVQVISRWRSLRTTAALKLKRTGGELKTRCSRLPSSLRSPTVPAKRWLSKVSSTVSMSLPMQITRGVVRSSSSLSSSTTLCDTMRISTLSASTAVSTETVESGNKKKVRFAETPTYFEFRVKKKRSRVVLRSRGSWMTKRNFPEPIVSHVKPKSLEDIESQIFEPSENELFGMDMLAKLLDARAAKAAQPAKLTFEDPALLPWPSTTCGLPKKPSQTLLTAPLNTKKSLFEDEDEEDEKKVVPWYSWASIRCRIECELLTLGIWLIIWFCIFGLLFIHIIRVILRIR